MYDFCCFKIENGQFVVINLQWCFQEMTLLILLVLYWHKEVVFIGLFSLLFLKLDKLFPKWGTIRAIFQDVEQIDLKRVKILAHLRDFFDLDVPDFRIYYLLIVEYMAIDFIINPQDTICLHYTTPIVCEIQLFHKIWIKVNYTCPADIVGSSPPVSTLLLWVVWLISGSIFCVTK